MLEIHAYLSGNMMLIAILLAPITIALNTVVTAAILKSTPSIASSKARLFAYGTALALLAIILIEAYLGVIWLFTYLGGGYGIIAQKMYTASIFYHVFVVQGLALISGYLVLKATKEE